MKKSFLPTLFALALCLVLLPASAFAADGFEYYSGADSATATATSYTELTSANAGSVSSGIYYVKDTFAVDGLSFTGDTTLVLGSGATLTVNGVLSCTGDLTVTTVEDATGAKLVVTGGTGSGAGGYGIYATGSVNIYAGTVEATGSDTTSNYAGSYGIYAYSGMTISGGEVTATGGESGSYTGSYGIYAYSGMTISGGEVTATGGESGSYTGSHGIYAYSGNVTVSGTAKVTAKGGNATGNFSCGIYAESGMTVSGGTVTATGGAASGFSYGIHAKSFAVNGGTVKATGGDVVANSSLAGSCGLEAEGITITDGEVTATAGTVTNTNANGSATRYGIYSYFDATISGGTVTLPAGSTINGTLKTEASGKTLLDYLADGTAYQQGSSIVLGNVMELSSVSVIAHTHSYDSNGSCVCGFTCNHTNVSDTGYCSTCETQLAVQMTAGGKTVYAMNFTKAVEALRNAGVYTEGSMTDPAVTVTVKLLADVGNDTTTATSETLGKGHWTLDLNGHTYYGSLTVSSDDDAKIKIEDSSVTSSGTSVGGIKGTFKATGSAVNFVDGYYLYAGTYGAVVDEMSSSGSNAVSKMVDSANDYYFFNANGSIIKGAAANDPRLDNVTVKKCTHENVAVDTGKCSVCEKPFAAGVMGVILSSNSPETVYYATIEDALTALEAMTSEKYAYASLNLCTDCTLPANVTFTSDFSLPLNLNGHTLTGDLTVAIGGECTVTNGTLNGNVTVNRGILSVYIGGKVGTVNANGGKVYVYGGTVGELTIGANASATLSGGTFTTKLSCDESHRLSEYLASGKAYYITQMLGGITTSTWHDGSRWAGFDGTSGEDKVEVKDAPITNASMSVDKTTVAYGETEASKLPTLTVSAAIADGVNVTYQFCYSTDGSTDVSSWNLFGGSSASNTFTFPNDRAPGTYYVGCKISVDSFTVYVKYATPITVEKGVQTVTTSPSGASGLQYDGSTKQLIATAGAASGGTVYYQVVRNGEVKVNWTEYTDEVKVINAGDYTVNWYVKGDDNHKDIGSETEPQGNFIVTIAKGVLPIASYPTNLNGSKGNALSSVTLPNGWTWVDGTQVMNASGDQTFAANYAGTDNYNAKSGVYLTVNVSDKTPQTITATDLTATYGDAGKKITATTNGNGTISYAVKSSSEDILSVDADTGVLTFKKAGTAIVTVSVSETATYAANSKDVTVTVNKADLTVTAKNQSIYVNGTVPDLTTPVKDTHYTVTGLVSGDTLSVAMEYRKDGAAATPDVTKAGSYEIAITATADTEKYEVTNNPGTLTINNKPSSGGGGGSSSNTTTTTKKNEDGSTTTTVTDKKTGTVTETTTTPNGTTSTTVTDKNGNSTTTVSVSKKDAQSGQTVPLPVGAVQPGSGTTINVTVPAGGATVEIPVKNPTPGTVIVIVNADGSEMVIPGSKVTGSGITVTLTGSAAIRVIDNSQTFSDVKERDYFAAAVQWASSRGITGGNSATTFGPHDSCTRAQLVTFLWRAAGQPEAKSESGMTDVANDTYYTEAVAWAFENGIVGGYGNGQFGSEDTITREQMAVILYRFAQLTGLNTTQSGTAAQAFSDCDSVSDYAVAAVQWAVNAGIMQGADGKLMPQEPCTRAQIVTMLYRLLGE